MLLFLVLSRYSLNYGIPLASKFRLIIFQHSWCLQHLEILTEHHTWQWQLCGRCKFKGISYKHTHTQTHWTKLLLSLVLSKYSLNYGMPLVFKFRLIIFQHSWCLQHLEILTEHHTCQWQLCGWCKFKCISYKHTHAHRITDAHVLTPCTHIFCIRKRTFICTWIHKYKHDI